MGPDNRHLQIQLIPAVFNLDEVVAIGYGTLARKELTSAVGYVSSERFLSGKVNNPIQGIKGLIGRNEYLGIFLVRYKLDTGYTDTGRRVYFGRKQAASRGRWGTRSILE